MKELEQQIWAAAFAAEFSYWRQLYMKATYHTIDHISGFTCAETADVALEKFREAVTGPDREYLIPVKEGWGRDSELEALVAKWEAASEAGTPPGGAFQECADALRGVLAKRLVPKGSDGT